MIVDSIQDIKGKNIVRMDLRDIDDTPIDHFVICEGDSSTQVRAIAQHVKNRLSKEMETKPNHIEGMMGTNWVLLDYFDIVVHVFYPETRQYYDLEGLWRDARFTTYENID